MKTPLWLALAFLLGLAACQPAPASAITILDGAGSVTVPATTRIPAELLVRGGLIVGPNDRALFRGMPVQLDQSLPESSLPVLQVRRAVALTLITPEGQRTIQTAAWTVGQALHDAGLVLYAADRIDPSPETALTSSLVVTYIPSRELTIHTNGGSVRARSAAAMVGEALADAGVPLLGSDFSQPSENQPVPEDGQLRVIHVSESLVLAQKPIPFESEFQGSADVPLDQQQVLNPGQSGLSMGRVRVRYEDGQEVSRLTESETLVRPPEKRIVGYGTKVEVRSATVDGRRIEYWRAVQMFATGYSPCHSSPSRCYPSTASGKPVKKGVVALRTDLYMAMRGQGLYIPGYGSATVEDACGGCVGKLWIDLGYSDSDYQAWGTWVTVYFLTPIPSNIIYVLD